MHEHQWQTRIKQAVATGVVALGIGACAPGEQGYVPPAPVMAAGFDASKTIVDDVKRRLDENGAIPSSDVDSVTNQSPTDVEPNTEAFMFNGLPVTIKEIVSTPARTPEPSSDPREAQMQQRAAEILAKRPDHLVGHSTIEIGGETFQATVIEINPPGTLTITGAEFVVFTDSSGTVIGAQANSTPPTMTLRFGNLPKGTLGLHIVPGINGQLEMNSTNQE